jgi:hypothetical protein
VLWIANDQLRSICCSSTLKTNPRRHARYRDPYWNKSHLSVDYLGVEIATLHKMINEVVSSKENLGSPSSCSKFSKSLDCLVMITMNYLLIRLTALVDHFSANYEARTDSLHFVINSVGPKTKLNCLLFYNTPRICILLLFLFDFRNKFVSIPRCASLLGCLVPHSGANLYSRTYYLSRFLLDG